MIQLTLYMLLKVCKKSKTSIFGLWCVDKASNRSNLGIIITPKIQIMWCYVVFSKQC